MIFLNNGGIGSFLGDALSNLLKILAVKAAPGFLGSSSRLTVDGAYEGQVDRADIAYLRSSGMTVDLRHFEKVYGSAGNDQVSIGGVLHKSFGDIDLGRGNDRLHLSDATSYRLKLSGVETVTGVAGSSLTVDGNARFETDGSIDIEAGGGRRHTTVTDIRFTDIVDDITISLGSGRHSLGFGAGFLFSVNGDGDLVVIRNAKTLTIAGGTHDRNLIFVVEGKSYTYSQLLGSGLVDTTAPSVVSVEASVDMITDANMGPAGFSISVTFDKAMRTDGSADPVLSFDSDIASTLTLTDWSWNGSGTIFSATYSVADAGLEVDAVTVGVSGAMDLALNAQQAYVAQVEFGIDTLNPSVLDFTEDNADGVVSDDDNVVGFSVTFSEAVAAISADDLEITGGSLSSGPVLADDGLSATFSVTAPNGATGNLVVGLKDSIVDANGNALVVPSVLSLAVDTANPTVSTIVRETPTALFTNSDTLVYRVSFDETIEGIDAADFSVSGTTATISSVSAVSGSSYDITLSGGDLASLNGDVTLSFDAEQDIVDSAGNALLSTAPTSTNQPLYKLDNLAPTVSLTSIGVADWGYRFFGTNMPSVNGEDSDSYPVTRAQIDWSKMWIELNGSGTPDITFTAADIAWVDPTQGSFWFGLTGDKISEINAAVDGGNDLIVVDQGFWGDLAGNVQLVGGNYSTTAVDLA